MTAEADECVGQSRRRVKLYTLNEERVWEDQGTGHVAYSYDEFKATSLVVRSEVNGMFTAHLLFHLQIFCFHSELYINLTWIQKLLDHGTKRKMNNELRVSAVTY